GYVEFVHALHAHASHGRIRDPSGAFVSASLESIAAAVESAVTGDVLAPAILDAPGPGAAIRPPRSQTASVQRVALREDAEVERDRGFWRLSGRNVTPARSR